MNDTTQSFPAKRPRKKQPSKKPSLDTVSQQLSDGGWEPRLTEESYDNIIAAGFSGKNLALACVASHIALLEQPITLRGLFYRVVSAGWLPNTDKPHSNRLGRIMTRLREVGIVPFSWLVDNLRNTDKPSSWAGISDFVDTVRDAYRRNFWADLPEYVHIFCEKDAIAGVLSPVTQEYNVSLSPIRGYCSLSFAHEIAELWNDIKKPIHAYYLGDFDPSGFDLERDVKAKLTRYCNRAFEWTRLGVNAEDFAEFHLLPLPIKRDAHGKPRDSRARKFIEQHGHDCAEVDALPPTELRRRIREAIEGHIPKAEWERLKTVEEAERESFTRFLAGVSQ